METFTTLADVTVKEKTAHDALVEVNAILAKFSRLYKSVKLTSIELRDGQGSVGLTLGDRK